MNKSKVSSSKGAADRATTDFDANRLGEAMTRAEAMGVDPLLYVAAERNSDGSGEQNYSPELTDAEFSANYEAERVAAKARPCDVAGCDGDLHEPDGDGEMHRFARTKFDGGEVEIEAYFYNGTYSASLWLEGVTGTMTPDDLRAKADLYEGLPALLREYADSLEARRVEALISRFTAESSLSDIYYACREQGANWGVVATAVLEKAEA